jgi:hypothetical protein
MSHKQRSIQYTRSGEERLEYWIVSDDGIISMCAPQRWHKVDLPDQTTPSTLERAAGIRYRATRTQFRDRVDDNAWLRSAKVADDSRYIALCSHIGIKV